MKTILLFIILFSSEVQTKCIVVKTNGDEIKLSSLVLHQSLSATSYEKLVVVNNGKSEVLDLKDLKRVNLQGSLSKKKGVTTWKALVIKRNDQKYEVSLNLIKISGTDQSGEEIELNSGNIDKISF